MKLLVQNFEGMCASRKLSASRLSGSVQIGMLGQSITLADQPDHSGRQAKSSRNLVEEWFRPRPRNQAYDDAKEASHEL